MTSRPRSPLTGPVSLGRSAWEWLLGVSVVLMFVTAPVSAADSVWRVDFDAAHREAIQTRRPLLIHFYGQTCPPCRLMERDVLYQPDVVQFLSAQLVAVKIDGSNPANLRGSQLGQRFGVQAWPTDIILDPLTGRVLSHAEGFQDRNRYLAVAAKARSNFDLTHQVAEKSPPSQPPAGSSPSTSPPGRSEIALGTPQSIVGLDGFSPVSLGAARKWVVGKPEYAFEFKSITYYMASEEELKAFQDRPEDFAPRLLGCDPVVLYETERGVPGKTDFGAFFDGDLFLFESDESRRRFKANPPKYTRIQHVLKIDNIQRVAEQPKLEPGVQ